MLAGCHSVSVHDRSSLLSWGFQHATKFSQSNSQTRRGPQSLWPNEKGVRRHMSTCCCCCCPHYRLHVNHLEWICHRALMDLLTSCAGMPTLGPALYNKHQRIACVCDRWPMDLCFTIVVICSPSFFTSSDVLSQGTGTGNWVARHVATCLRCTCEAALCT